jgi:hypothetical protein
MPVLTVIATHESRGAAMSVKASLPACHAGKEALTAFQSVSAIALANCAAYSRE